MGKVIDLGAQPYQKAMFRPHRDWFGMVTARGVGKSWTARNLSAVALLRGEKVIYMAPTLSLLKREVFPKIATLLRSWGFKPEINKSELTITIKGSAGAIYGASYENYESIRGADGISLVVWDEFSRAKDIPDILAAVALTIRAGAFEARNFVCTTFRKGSEFNQLWKTGFFGNTPENFVTDVTMDMNTKITKQELDLAKRTMGINAKLYEQEIMGKMVDGDVDFAVFPQATFSNTYLGRGGACRMGIDCAGSGRDYNVFCVSDDNGIVEIKKVQIADTLELAAIARSLIAKYDVQAVNIDGTGGFGQGLYDILKLEYENVNSVNFGRAAVDKPNYANARAEMFFGLAQKIKGGFYVVDREIREELGLISFSINSAGKTQLIPKETIKKVLQRSPDSSDALALSVYDVECEIIPQADDTEVGAIMEAFSF